MTTGTPYAPPPLSTSYVVPQAGGGVPFRTLPYISPTQYSFAPTAVATAGLVPKSTSADTDSLAALADVVNRASGWVDQEVFHKPSGDFVAGPSTESMWVKVKLDGSIAILCNQTPVLEITALALGPSPSQLSAIDANTAQDLWIEDQVVTVPWGWSTGLTPFFPRPVGPGGGCFVVWTYIAGYPHFALGGSSPVSAGATAITLNPAAGQVVTGIYAGSTLNIIDQAKSETVVVQATPTTNAISISPTANAHSQPVAPDFIPVTAIPKAVEQATIFLTNVLIKTRGSRAMILPGAAGAVPTRTAMAQSGALDDYENACRLLHDFVVPVLH